MVTFSQLLKLKRPTTKRKNKVPSLNKNPQKKGTCLKVFTTTPKKPNSALRKVARIQLTNKAKVTAYIPGEGHTLQEYSVVLIRGGRTRDLPGVKYKVIRGKYDLGALIGRKTSRSKYGAKRI